MTVLNEFYAFDYKTTSKIISFCISVLLVFLMIVFWILAYFIAKRSIKTSYDPNRSYFNEIVSGTKPNLWWKLLVFTAISRILLSISWVIFTQTFSIKVRLSIFVWIQLFFFILTICTRPFENTSDNITQILNEFVFLSACISLYRYYSETNWANGYIAIFFITIAFNGVIIIFIQFIVLSKELWLWINKKRHNVPQKINGARITSIRVDSRPQSDVIFYQDIFYI